METFSFNVYWYSCLNTLALGYKEGPCKHQQYNNTNILRCAPVQEFVLGFSFGGGGEILVPLDYSFTDKPGAIFLLVFSMLQQLLNTKSSETILWSFFDAGRWFNKLLNQIIHWQTLFWDNLVCTN